MTDKSGMKGGGGGVNKTPVDKQGYDKPGTDKPGFDKTGKGDTLQKK